MGNGRIAAPPRVPRPGEGKRGPDGHLGYLVRQANVDSDWPRSPRRAALRPYKTSGELVWDPQSGRARLASPISMLRQGETPEVGGRPRYVQVPFDLAEIPARPALRLGFHVITAGRCPVTYKPTVVTVNGRKVKEIDFRDFTSTRQGVDINLPPDVLKVGSNTVQISTGECQYGVDRMRIVELALN